jgi:hypothetical protein
MVTIVPFPAAGASDKSSACVFGEIPMHYTVTDHAFFRKLNKIRIAWPFFLVSSFARKDTSRPSSRWSIAVLTRSEIQGLFADDLDLHPAPLGSLHARHRRPAGTRTAQPSTEVIKAGRA